MSDDADKPDGRPPRERLPPKKSQKIRKPQTRLRLEPDDEAEDPVGYGKPPRAHQFKAGQSGNPNGRPKGSKNE